MRNLTARCLVYAMSRWNLPRHFSRIFRQRLSITTALSSPSLSIVTDKRMAMWETSYSVGASSKQSADSPDFGEEYMLIEFYREMKTSTQVFFSL
jgi:hypothetical protein